MDQRGYYEVRRELKSICADLSLDKISGHKNEEQDMDLCIAADDLTESDIIESENEVEYSECDDEVDFLKNCNISHDLAEWYIAHKISEAAVHFSWFGHHGNTPVHSFAAMNIIKECTSEKFPNARVTEVINVIKKWFQYAKDRQRKKLKLTATLN